MASNLNSDGAPWSAISPQVYDAVIVWMTARWYQVESGVTVERHGVTTPWSSRFIFLRL